MMTGDPLVILMVSRELVAMVTGDLLVPPEISRELVAIVNRSLMVPLVVSRGLAAMVTGVPLVPLVVSRGLVAMVSPVIVGNPIVFVTETPGMLGPSGIFMGIADFLVESSWETVDSDTGLPLLAAGEVSGEDTTLAVSGAEESRKVWFPGLSPISGTLFVLRLVVIELDVGIPETKERERVVVSDIHKGALFGDASVMFFAPTLPKRRRSRIISKATGMSRSWDLRVGKLEK